MATLERPSYYVGNFSDEEREAYAFRLLQKALRNEDWKLPKLDIWNYDNCREHRYGWVEKYWNDVEKKELERLITDRPADGCRKCAIIFRQHQRIGVAWLYFKKRALLADTMGAGKTSTAGGLLAMLKQTGELADPKHGGMGRALIIPRSPALRQWQQELHRMMPRLAVQVATGTAAQREAVYAQPWDVMLIGPQMLSNQKSGDLDALMERFQYSLVMTDDIDLLRNENNQAYNAITRVGEKADRLVIMSGTPVQKKLPELWAQFYPIGGAELFGDRKSFEAAHITTQVILKRDPKSGLPIGQEKVPAYRDLDIVKKKIRPLYLRRTAADLKDVTLPIINSENVLLELYPSQREKYRELQKGVLKILKETGEEKHLNHVAAMAQLTYGAQICTGLAALGEEDLPKTSSKLDWVMDQLKPGGDLGNEKVVIFAQYKNTVRALQRRLEGWDIGYTTIWGENKNSVVRQAAQDRFWDDPSCRVLIGTQAIEQSLNLQVARHLINVDMILNPARMEQLAGRIRRDGSAYKHVFVHNLLTVETQEERYLPLLEREAALAAFLWDESSELFEALSPMMMLHLILG